MSPDRHPPTGHSDGPGPGPTASVVAFQPATRRFRREARMDETARGEILLFTGVRYERLSEAPSPRLRLRS